MLVVILEDLGSIVGAKEFYTVVGTTYFHQ